MTMSRKLRIGVLFGGRSGEHEVSLVSATSVLQALDREKYDVVPIGITPEGKWISSGQALRLLKEKAGAEQEPERFLAPEPNRRALMAVDGAAGEGLDVVFPVLHGMFGEDGTVQGLFELAGIPYVGAGVLGSALGLDKIVQKQLFAQAGLPIARYLWVLSRECVDTASRVAARAQKTLRFPMFVKPANTGSSVGITKAHTRKELLEGLAVAARFDRKVIVEEGVNDIREIECAVLGNDVPEVSVPGEIVPSNEFYDYDAKYVDGKSAAIIPAKLPAAVTRRIREIAARAFMVLDCSGMARVDFFVTRRRHRVYLNEINTIPGFTSISMYPKLWEASGLSYSRLLDRLIQLALDRHNERSSLQHSYQPDKDWYRR
jgi:D-alanine-D-alanine ligase